MCVHSRLYTGRYREGTREPICDSLDVALTGREEACRPQKPGRELPPEGSRAEEPCHQQSAVRSLPSEEASGAFSASGPLFLECVALTFGPMAAFYRAAS